MKKLAPSNDSSIYHGGVWPTEEQQLLLRAALLDAPAATEAWAAWLQRAQTDSLDAGSWKLIPQVYVNLKRLGVNDPLLPQAKLCHLHSWTCNQRLFHQSAGFLEELRQSGIPALVLKGVALANLYYPDTGARPMADLDVLVPPAKFLELGRRLLDEGWKQTDGHSFDSFRMDYMPSYGFMRPDGFWVDLHCHVLHADCGPRADDEFWSRAQPWNLRHAATLTLAPEDQLLHVISHGVRWCDVSPFRWIADAWWILARSGAEFDWDRFCSQVRHHHVNLHILRGLEFMDKITPLNLPPGLLGRVESIPFAASATVRYIADTRPLPTEFFPRAAAIWKMLGEEEPGYSIAGVPRANKRPGRELRRIPLLLWFGLKVAIRDRKQFWGNG